MKKYIFFALITVLFSCSKEEGVQLIFDGDSLTMPSPPDGGTEWPLLLKEQVGDKFRGWDNFGVGGQTVAQMLADEEEQVLSVKNSDSTILFVWAGINDLYKGATAYTLQKRISAYHKAANDEGIKTIAFTLTPTQNPKYPQLHLQIEAERQKYNAWLRKNWQRIGAMALVDLAADPRIGNYNSVLNKRFFQADRIHMNKEGRMVVAELGKAKLILN